MQATNVKQVSKPQLANNAVQQVLIKQSEQLDIKAAKVIDYNKTEGFNRFLEAYGDCV